jgi:hypothetical protein
MLGEGPDEEEELTSREPFFDNTGMTKGDTHVEPRSQQQQQQQQQQRHSVRNSRLL